MVAQCTLTASSNDLRQRGSMRISDRLRPSAMTSGITSPRLRHRSVASFIGLKPSIGQLSSPLADAASIRVCAAKRAFRAAQLRTAADPNGTRVSEGHTLETSVWMGVQIAEGAICKNFLRIFASLRWYALDFSLNSDVDSTYALKLDRVSRANRLPETNTNNVNEVSAARWSRHAEAARALSAGSRSQ